MCEGDFMQVFLMNYFWWTGFMQPCKKLQDVLIEKFEDFVLTEVLLEEESQVKKMKREREHFSKIIIIVIKCTVKVRKIKIDPQFQNALSSVLCHGKVIEVWLIVGGKDQ